MERTTTNTATNTTSSSSSSTTSTTTSSSNLFIKKDGSPTLATIIILLAIPIMYNGHKVLGIITIFIGFSFATRSAMDQMKDEDKQEIRCNILGPEDLLAELEVLDTLKQTHLNDSQVNDKRKIQYLATLSALAKKWNTYKANSTRKKKNPQSQQQQQNRNQNLPLICQQAAYITLRGYPEDDDIVSGSISLLALVAKDSQVRQRNKYQADEYGLDKPIMALRKALERAQQLEETTIEEEGDDDNNNNADTIEEQEEKLAEIQRKGCLFLGALSDGDKEYDLAIKIVEEDGLEAIIDAANWFRYHDDVVNWALWAIFILCYDNSLNKIQLVRLNGIDTVCTSLKNIPTSLEVNRHGIAVLFDLLREEDPQEEQNRQQQQKSYKLEQKIDVWEVRRRALASGLHVVVKSAMEEFSDSMDIMMMGQEMLVGTGYRGDVPEYQQL